MSPPRHASGSLASFSGSQQRGVWVGRGGEGGGSGDEDNCYVPLLASLFAGG